MEPDALDCAPGQRLGWNLDFDSVNPGDLVFCDDVQGSAAGGKDDQARFQGSRSHDG